MTRSISEYELQEIERFIDKFEFDYYEDKRLIEILRTLVEMARDRT